jgi:predicted membrane protein
MVCVLGVIGYFVDLSQVWSKNYGKGQMAGFRTEMLLQSLDTTKFALICVLVAILFSSIVSYVLRRRVTKERNKIKLSKSKRSGFIEKMLQDLGKELTAALEQFFGDTLLSQIAELKSEVNECILKI